MDGDEPHLKYAHVERERRFVLDGVPPDWAGVPARHLHDRYLDGTRLPLRAVEVAGSPPSWNLGHKVRFDRRSPGRVAHSSLYLSEPEATALAALPAAELVKVRRTRAVGGRVWAVDEYQGHLAGLVLAEVGLGEVGVAGRPPMAVIAEVTEDDRFSGGALARLPTGRVADLLAGVRAGDR